MEQRAKSERRRLSVEDLALDIWDAAEIEDRTPLKEWLAKQPEAKSSIEIPEDKPAFFPDNPLFELNTVCFGKAGKIRMEYRSREQAELAFHLANYGISGPVTVPLSKEACRAVLGHMKDRIKRVNTLFGELAESRTSDDRIRAQLIEVLERWYIQGKKITNP